MKSVSVREFYHNAGLVDGLPEGRQLIVTARGKPNNKAVRGHRSPRRFATNQARRAPARFCLARRSPAAGGTKAASAAALCRFVCDDWHADSGSLLDRCLFVAFHQFPLGRLKLDLRRRELRKGAEALP